MAPVRNYLSTGCAILDLAIADRLPGGFGAGGISHIWGPESSAKSVLIAEPLGSAIRQGGKATLVDVEGTFDFARAESVYGVDVSRLEYISAETEEIEALTVSYMFDSILRKKIGKSSVQGRPSALGIDSLSAVTSDREYEKEMNERGYGTTRAMDLSEGFRKYIWGLNRANLALLFVDQSRDKIGSFVGGKTFSGGNALRFYASTRVYVERRKPILNKHDKEIGINVFFKVDKNKIAPPFRNGEFRLLWDYGIDDIGTSLQFIQANTTGLGKGTYQLPGGKRILGINRAIHAVEDAAQEAELRAEVARLWDKTYCAEQRKPKRRTV